ncbi:MAG: potassium-transporting ATPase subunit C [Kribbellaceae bacterium]
MASTLTGPVRQFGVAARAVAVFTLALGIVYPVVMTGAGQALFNDNANGSAVQVDGKDVGSDLIGQPYTRQVTENGQPKVDEEGEPVMEADPQWFQTRPSAVDYDGLGSSASQLGPNNEDLVAAIQQRRTTVAALEGVRPEDVPADALTASGSGLDPQISPEYAAIQVNRVARERGLDAGRLHELVDQHTKGRVLGFLGEPRVNVVELNAELAGMG